MVARCRATTLPAWRRRRGRPSSSRSGIPATTTSPGSRRFANPGVAEVELVERRADRRLPDHRPARPLPRRRSATSPTALCLESKSLKLYLNSFRNEGVFCEALAVRIRDDVAAALELPADRVSVDARAEGARRHHDHRPCLRRRAGRGRRPVRRRLARAAPARGAARSGRSTRRTCCRPGWPRWTSRSRSRFARRCSTAVARDDTGYADVGRLRRGVRRLRGHALRLGRSSPERVRLVADVMSAVAELLRALDRAGRRRRRQPARLPAVLPGRRARSGRTVVEVPLARDRRRVGSSISTASSRRSPPARGPTCSATRTTRPGTSFPREQLEAVAELAAASRRGRDRRRGPRADDDGRGARTSRSSRSAMRPRSRAGARLGARRPGTSPG